MRAVRPSAAFASALAGLVSFGVSAEGADDPSPGDLSVSVRVEDAAGYAEPDDPGRATLVLSLARTPRRAFRGAIDVAAGGAQRTIPFDLTGRRGADVRLAVPIDGAGPRPGVDVDLAVRVGATRLAALDLRVERDAAWYVAGPFAGGVEESHAKALPPERDASLDERYESGDGATIAWAPLPVAARREDGGFDLGAVFGGASRTAYVQTRVRAARAGPARLLVGSDDSVRAWLNGREVLDRKVLRGCRPGEDQVPVALREGENTLLLKVCQASGAWGFAASFDDGAGRPVDGLRPLTAIHRVRREDAIPRPVAVTRTSAVLSWRSMDATPSRLVVVAAAPGRARPVEDLASRPRMVRPAEGAAPWLVEDALPTTTHTLRVGGLEPGTRYLVSFAPRSPAEEPDTMSVVTEPPAGAASVLRLRVAVVLFTNAVPAKDAERPGARERVAAEAVDLAKARCEAAAEFFFRNSAMRLWLDNEFLVDDTFHAFPDDASYGVGLAAGWPQEGALRRLLEARGETPQDYDAVAYVTLDRYWDGTAWANSFSGGGTFGPDVRFGIGNSSWKGGHDCAWLYVHEVGHQIDALYHASGLPEFLFNHFQPWDGTAHRHGEHYDGNAWLLREWSGIVTRQHQGWPPLRASLGFRWFTSRWGALVLVPDADEDGVPDDEPFLPLDERRLGSDPARRDTDRDGLDDLEEALATIGAAQGLQEVWAGDRARQRCDPSNPDSDGDGVRDGVDPAPVSAVPCTVPLLAPHGDPRARVREETPFVAVDEPEAKASFQLGYVGDGLLLAGTCDADVREIRVYLDLDDDGWYVGRDNLHLVVVPGGGLGGKQWLTLDGGRFGAALHNAGVPGKWPFYDAPLGEEAFAFESGRTEEGFAFALVIRRDPSIGLDLVAGERMGIQIAVRPGRSLAGRPGAEGMLTPFEPHVFHRVELGR